MKRNLKKTFRFRNFQVYKDGRKFVKELKDFSKKKFPKTEIFGLRSQLWRALDSILLNIAEGSDRGTDKDFAKFLNQSHTSLNEVVSCLDISVDCEYISEEEQQVWLNKAANLSNQLTAFRKSLLGQSEVRVQRSEVNKGFTLIEMLIYISIMSMMILVIGAFIPRVVMTNLYLQAKGQSLDNARIALGTIEREIKSASDIYAPTSVFGSSPGQLSLESANNLPVGETNTFTDFYVDDERLFMKKEGSDPQLLTADKVKVSNLVLTNLNIGDSYPAIRVSLTVFYNSASPMVQNQSSVTLTSTVSMRNY
ncbi:MAG: four helix bundle protein [bacterium]|nr:four helix bundle protein [bacterium]